MFKKKKSLGKKISIITTLFPILIVIIGLASTVGVAITIVNSVKNFFSDAFTSEQDDVILSIEELKEWAGSDLGLTESDLKNMPFTQNQLVAIFESENTSWYVGDVTLTVGSKVYETQDELVAVDVAPEEALYPGEKRIETITTGEWVDGEETLLCSFTEHTYPYRNPWQLTMAVSIFVGFDRNYNIVNPEDIEGSEGLPFEELEVKTINGIVDTFKSEVEFVTDYTIMDGAYIGYEEFFNNEYAYSTYSDSDTYYRYPKNLISSAHTFLYDYEFEYDKKVGSEVVYTQVSRSRTTNVGRFMENLGKYGIDRGDMKLFLEILKTLPGGETIAIDIDSALNMYEMMGGDYSIDGTGLGDIGTGFDFSTGTTTKRFGNLQSYFDKHAEDPSAWAVGYWTREEFVEMASSFVGIIPYQLGGKYSGSSAYQTVNPRWLTPMPNRKPYGLDCSGFITYLYRQLSEIEFVDASGYGGGLIRHKSMKRIDKKDLRLGDISYMDKNIRGNSYDHFGIYAGKDNKGRYFIHCTASGGQTMPYGGVVISYLRSETSAYYAGIYPPVNFDYYYTFNNVYFKGDK